LIRGFCAGLFTLHFLPMAYIQTQTAGRATHSVLNIKIYQWASDIYFRLGPCISNFDPQVSSRVSSRNEFSQVGTSSEKARKTRSDPNFWKMAISETRENKNRKKLRFSRVRKCSESTEITKIFPKFEKRQFPKLTKTKISEKNV